MMYQDLNCVGRTYIDTVPKRNSLNQVMYEIHVISMWCYLYLFWTAWSILNFNGQLSICFLCFYSMRTWQISIQHTSRYIHCLWTVSSISTTSRMWDKVLSHLSTSCSKALTNLDAFIVESCTWLSSRAVNTSSVLL